jgi:hypothetical protein
MGFDKLTDFGTKINVFDIDDFADGVGAQGGNLGRRGLGVNEEYLFVFYGAEAATAAAKRLIANVYAVGFEQSNQVFKYSLLIHRSTKITGVQEKGRQQSI